MTPKERIALSWALEAFAKVILTACALSVVVIVLGSNELDNVTFVLGMWAAFILRFWWGVKK